MPWKETSVMEERMKFIFAYQEKVYSLSELCRQFGISRTTAYKWLDRYDAEGPKGIQDRSRAPLAHPNQVDEALVRLIIRARDRHPTWGPKKLLPWLKKNHPEIRRWPVESTVGEILKREGLVKSRQPRHRASPTRGPLQLAKEANTVWCADFKGWFHTGDGIRCEPFTLSDASSRFLLRCQALRQIHVQFVKPLFEAAFREYGLPQVIRTDNGPPFASTSLCGLTPLSVWWIQLGIFPERIEPGRPYQNGIHERMHKTLKAETVNPPKQTLRAQQRAFDRFRQEYNEDRPHETLGQVPPAQKYQPSTQSYRGRPAAFAYPSGLTVRSVKRSGEFCWRGRMFYLSESLRGEKVGLLQKEDGCWTVYFRQFALGEIDERTWQFQRRSHLEMTPEW